MVFLTVPDRLIVMTYLCQIRAFFTGQELNVVQLAAGHTSQTTYKVGKFDTDSSGSIDPAVFYSQHLQATTGQVECPGTQDVEETGLGKASQTMVDREPKLDMQDATPKHPRSEEEADAGKEEVSAGGDLKGSGTEAVQAGLEEASDDMVNTQADGTAAVSNSATELVEEPQLHLLAPADYKAETAKADGKIMDESTQNTPFFPEDSMVLVSTSAEKALTNGVAASSTMGYVAVSLVGSGTDEKAMANGPRTDGSTEQREESPSAPDDSGTGAGKVLANGTTPVLGAGMDIPGNQRVEASQSDGKPLASHSEKLVAPPRLKRLASRGGPERPLQRSLSVGSQGPVAPPRPHAGKSSFAHVRDADLVKKRRSRLKSESLSLDEVDAGNPSEDAAQRLTAVSDAHGACHTPWLACVADWLVALRLHCDFAELLLPG